VALLASTRSGGINAVDAHVLGLFSTVSKAHDDSALRAPLPLAYKLLRISGVHRWVVVLKHTDDTKNTLERLRKILPTANLDIVPWYDLADCRGEPHCGHHYHPNDFK
jgi:putative ABC transport system permease protein